jgi:hypothetical protein
LADSRIKPVLYFIQQYRQNDREKGSSYEKGDIIKNSIPRNNPGVPVGKKKPEIIKTIPVAGEQPPLKIEFLESDQYAVHGDIIVNDKVNNSW